MKQKINKLVHGVGLCDIPSRENGKQSKAYKAWQRMVGRCYDPKVHTRQPTYIGCSVVDEWKTFSNFKKFYDTHYRDGYQLDKDLLVDGNKVYGPEACIFVPQPINLLFVDNGVSRGVCPLGVCFYKPTGKYRAQLVMYGKQHCLGSFSTAGEAHQVYLKSKREHCHKVAIESYMKDEIDERTMNAIIAKAYRLV